MLYLAIDTSANSGSIALEKDGKIIFVFYTDIQITHSERLMPQIEQAFKVNNLSAKDLDAVLLSNGPGSFTGIRIGLATAKGICYAHQIPLIPFNTLEMHAVNAIHRNHLILSVIDAKMNEIYASLYDENLTEKLAPQCCPVDKLIEDLKKLNISQVILCGDIMEALTIKLTENHIHFHLLAKHQNLNMVTSLFTLFELRQIKPEWDMQAFSDLEPYYVRSSLAQINKKDKKTEI
jgi:tRNA threonylcarbamoyladenosine biosynthesis protein TsaB